MTFVVLELAELVGRRPAWERVVKGVNMEMSQLGREMFERGELKTKREDLTAVVKLRFPEVWTPDVEHAIADLSELPIMKKWFQAAIDSDTGEELLRVLKR